MKKRMLLLLFSVILVSSVSAQVIRPAYWSMAGNNITTSGGGISFLGTTNNYPLIFRTSDTTRMYISSTGNVGFNTDLPQQMLHVVDGNILISKTSSNAKAPGSPNGSLFFGKDVSSTDPYGSWGIEYLNDPDDGFGLNFWKPWTSTQQGANYLLFLHDNGKVGIGTKNPQAKLAVNGDFLAKSVRVNTNAEYWPDFVFEKDYNLMSLKELELFINTYKHLPGVPSAKEIEEQGEVDLAKMNELLLQKIEELTKYVIDLQKQIDEMKEGKEGTR